MLASQQSTRSAIRLGSESPAHTGPRRVRSSPANAPPSVDSTTSTAVAIANVVSISPARISGEFTNFTMPAVAGVTGSQDPAGRSLKTLPVGSHHAKQAAQAHWLADRR